MVNFLQDQMLLTLFGGVIELLAVATIIGQILRIRARSEASLGPIANLTARIGAWWAMWGPPGMPADLTRTINGWVNDAVQDLGAEGRLAALGIEPSAETPQAFADFLAEDIDRSATLLKAANFQPE